MGFALAASTSAYEYFQEILGHLIEHDITASVAFSMLS
jgi:hypothetical protein